MHGRSEAGTASKPAHVQGTCAFLGGDREKKGAETRKSDGAAPGSSRSYGVRPVPSTGSSSLPDGGWCKCKQEGGVDDGLGHVGLTRGNLIWRKKSEEYGMQQWIIRNIIEIVVPSSVTRRLRVLRF